MGACGLSRGDEDDSGLGGKEDDQLHQGRLSRKKRQFGKTEESHHAVWKPLWYFSGRFRGH